MPFKAHYRMKKTHFRKNILVRQLLDSFIRSKIKNHIWLIA